MTALGAINRQTDVAISNDALPPGLIMAFPQAAAPHAGWLPCDGRVVYFQNDPGGNNYLALYNALGGATHVYNGGSSPAVDRFRLPGLMPNTATINGVAANGVSRTPVGPNGDTVGATGGNHTHSHTANTLAMPNHGHTVGSYAWPDHGHGHTLSAPNHNHSIFTQVVTIFNAADTNESIGTFGTDFQQPGLSGGINNAGGLGAAGSLTGGGATSATGATGTTPALPFVGLAWMIKT